ncbi:MAG: sulfatase [Draconibacterium sp.]|nr:sulfatase [Draconibacterium sp.]
MNKKFEILRELANYSGLIAIMFLFSFSSCKKAEKYTSRPNIIFIMADDHAIQSISSYGSNLISTPGIDRLAREGMKFTNCFSVNSLCAPSRAALITGKYNRQNGVLRIGDRLNENQETFPKYLQQAGYSTALIGKWHLISEPQGFDYYSVFPGQGNYFNCRFKDKTNPWQDGNNGGIEKEGFVTDIITDLAIKWIENRDTEKPFFLMVHHKAPHTPHEYPDKFATLFKNKELPFPETFYDDFEGKNQELSHGNAGFSRLDHIYPDHFREKIPKNLNAEEFRKWTYQAFFKGYLRLVASLDENIVRLLAYIDQSGLVKNTIVIYTSDNGFFHGEHGLFNKMWMYEESMRIPLLIRYPGVIKENTVNNNLVSILDFAPTFVDFADAKIPADFQGKSIKKLLSGEKPVDWRNEIYYHYFNQWEVPEHEGIRTEKFKLIHFYDNSGKSFGELYNLEKDPGEMKNLYFSPENETIKMELETKLDEIKKSFESVKQ